MFKLIILLTSGHTHGLASVILNVAIVTGLKSSNFGYMSSGDSVYNKITSVILLTDKTEAKNYFTSY